MPKSLAGRDVGDVADALTSFVNRTIMARGRPMTPEEDFEAVGVDSMGMLKVLLFIEAEYGFWMPDEDLQDDNVRSPGALAAYICRRLKVS